jgi:hypothetical protein
LVVAVEADTVLVTVQQVGQELLLFPTLHQRSVAQAAQSLHTVQVQV